MGQSKLARIWRDYWACFREEYEYLFVPHFHPKRLSWRNLLFAVGIWLIWLCPQAVVVRFTDTHRIRADADLSRYLRKGQR